MVHSFTTDTGIAVPAVTAAQMREIDRIATEETGPDLLQMMENAGRNLALAVIDMLGSGWQRARIMVLAGSGGNGGGGICGARHLSNRNVRVSICIANPQKLAAIVALQRHVYSATSGTEINFEHIDRQPADLIVDAIIGYGLTSAPHGRTGEMIQWANATQKPVLALDVPSGVDATTGDAPGEYIRADQTLTLALPKTGLFPDKTGRLALADIGIPITVFRKIGLDYQHPFDQRYRVPLFYTR